jgi:hypothetical protein
MGVGTDISQTSLQWLKKFPHYFALEPIFNGAENNVDKSDDEDDKKADGTYQAMTVRGPRIIRDRWNRDGAGGFHDPITSESILMDWFKKPENAAGYLHGCRDANGRKISKEKLCLEVQDQIKAAGITMDRPVLSIQKKLNYFLDKYQRAYLWEKSPEGSAMLKKQGRQAVTNYVRFMVLSPFVCC